MSVFGIDLGTTNSLIGNEDLNYLSEIVPSCVDIRNGKAGKDYFDDPSATRSFKIDMSMGIEGIVPKQASRLVLEELIRVAERDTGAKVEDVVISVPAYFNESQRTATAEAAESAGLNLKGLVNEPTAAAMYIAKERKGLLVVYDLGGGTFDCSIIDSRFGAYDVQATSGMCVGGDNFDKNIMKFFVKHGKIPLHHLSASQCTMLQHFCSKQKIEMQKRREVFDIDLREYGGQVISFDPTAYDNLMKMTFGDTMTCMKSLISKWIPSSEVFGVLLVGGSTHCPFLKEWIEDSVGMKTEALTYDPDRVVAQGAALYAKLSEQGALGYTVSDVTKTLSIGLDDGTVGVVVPANSKIPLTHEKLFTNPRDTESLRLDLYQGESMFIKDNERIGTLVWKYDYPKPAGTGDVIVKISIDANGMIKFEVSELLHEPKVVYLNRSKESC